MTPFRAWSHAFVISLVVHLSFLILPYRSADSKPLPQVETLAVDWVEVPAAPAPQIPPVASPETRALQDEASGSDAEIPGSSAVGLLDAGEGGDLPREAAGGSEKASEEAATPEKEAPEEVIQPTLIEEVMAPPVSSESLLQDEETAADFTPYVVAMRSRIREVAERHRRFIVRERGNVRVNFVLNRKGRIVLIETRAEGGLAHKLLEKRAKTILSESAPFGDFPQEITAPSVSFAISLHFDD